MQKHYGLIAQGEALPKFQGVGLPDTSRNDTIRSVGATNPSSTISESGYPQPTISGFFVPALWATNPDKRTNKLHTHAVHGGGVPAFAVWSRGPNKPVRVNKARLLSEVVEAMPHPICSMADSLNRENTGHDLYLPDSTSPRLPFGRASSYPHYRHHRQHRGPSPRQLVWLVTGVHVPHP